MSRAMWMACVACVLALAGMGIAGPVSGDSPPDGDIIAIAAAPGTIALNAENLWLTVHADIAFGAVADVVVEIDGIEVPVRRAFADSIGDLVVKCFIDDVKGLVGEAGSAKVTLSVVTVLGDEFTGSDTVKVVSGGPK